MPWQQGPGLRRPIRPHLALVVPVVHHLEGSLLGSYVSGVLDNTPALRCQSCLVKVG